MITTISEFPPMIDKCFDPYLLLSTLERKRKRYEEIYKLYIKKVRPCDTGRMREFINLEKRFNEVYDQKTTEEADYCAKIEEKNKKRPHLQNAKTTRFSRTV